ncbi:MAG: 50S ribosomal protein L22 [Parcubacteria group bacterium GW2011_GWB1_50_9]|uniref:Large ribosomal subunit protein uL22 n=1 Tax=Candidatus Adlerbacteria bacterium GW2011_GWC1_50_9 TaxID=1618608 RepID=A0A0G1WR30_9BACT|nr:MAG: 50S ribosomal protein L22 [Parcubacteria group bacterium GW2011_GWB1_50_9]KKW21313.1 MAG: 50S ribosomal protein L22 [Candidatus Adlerbacteria bacterium GW2011_GWC1_50_9]KKW33829.1 MAG: 50S ribosomal protein L22 [Parcubacteria group bacterium GW2011_GWA1_53_13]
MNEITAELNYVAIAPRKVRLVADMIRGMDVARAETQLLFLTKRASHPLAKLLKSAVANAKNNFRVDESDLIVQRITVDGGPVGKRTRARAFGRAARIRKRTSHVTLVLGTRSSKLKNQN